MNVYKLDNAPDVLQVQPEDMLFASQASQEIVKAISGSLSRMFNSQPEDAVVLQGLHYDYKKVDSIRIRFSVTSGIVLHRDRLYYIPALNEMTVVGTNTEIQSKLRFSLPDEPIVVSPSPVKDIDLNNVVNVHYAYRGQLFYEMMPLPEISFRWYAPLDNEEQVIKWLPFIAELETYGDERQIIPLK